MANVLFSNELAKRYAKANLNISSVSLHPGFIRTALIREQPVLGFIIHMVGTAMRKSIEQGAATTLYCVANDAVKNGLFYTDCNEKECKKEAQDAELCKSFFEKSLAWTKVDCPAALK